MFDRSRAFIYVSLAATTVDEVLHTHGAWLRKWGFRPKSALPPGVKGGSGTEVREQFLREPAPSTPAAAGWLVLAVEDVQHVLETAYTLSKALPKVAVLVSRAYKYGDWCFKAYFARDCVVKVGDDADLELAWLTQPLTTDRVAEVARQLAPNNREFEGFLRDVTCGEADPEAFRLALGAPPLTEGFGEIRDRGLPGWRYVLYVHQDSGLAR